MKCLCPNAFFPTHLFKGDYWHGDTSRGTLQYEIRDRGLWVRAAMKVKVIHFDGTLNVGNYNKPIIYFLQNNW